MFGDQAARRKQQTRAKRTWSERDFFEALASEVSEEHASSVRTLIEWARPRVKHFSWGEGQSPSCTLVFNTPDGPIQPISIWTGTFDGFSINFAWVRRRPTPIVEQFLDRLSIIDQIGDLHDDTVAAGYAKRRSVPLDALDDERIAMLMGAIEELIAEPSDQ